MKFPCDVIIHCEPNEEGTEVTITGLNELIRCKDCKHQRKEYREDKRRKDGGYNIYWCELVDGYAPLGFDDEYCAWAERKEE